jgi:hypothetical protein
MVQDTFPASKPPWRFAKDKMEAAGHTMVPGGQGRPVRQFAKLKSQATKIHSQSLKV